MITLLNLSAPPNMSAVYVQKRTGPVSNVGGVRCHNSNDFGAGSVERNLDTLLTGYPASTLRRDCYTQALSPPRFDTGPTTSLGPSCK